MNSTSYSTQETQLSYNGIDSTEELMVFLPKLPQFSVEFRETIEVVGLSLILV